MIISHAHVKNSDATLCGQKLTRFSYYPEANVIHMCECNWKVNCADCVDLQSKKIETPNVNKQQADLEAALRIIDQLRKENAQLEKKNQVIKEDINQLTKILDSRKKRIKELTTQNNDLLELYCELAEQNRARAKSNETLSNQLMKIRDIVK